MIAGRGCRLIDPFDSPRRRLSRAKEHILNIDTRSRSFSQSKPFKRVVETNSEELLEHKIKLTSVIPDKITDLAYEAVEALRSALDQAVYAIATVWNVKRLDLVQFPIADTRQDVEKALNHRLNGLPPEIISLIRSFEPYQTGNRFVWALNRIRRQTVHRLIVPAGLTRGPGGIVFTNLPKMRITPHFRVAPPTWDVEKNEMVYIVASPEDHFEYILNYSVEIAFGPTVEGVGRRRVLPFLNSAAHEVERIVACLEAETQ